MSTVATTKRAQRLDNSYLDIQIFKLLLKLVHESRDLINIHTRERFLHTLGDTLHTGRDLSHAHGRFNARGAGIYSRRHAQMRYRLIFFTYSILRVNAGTFRVALFDSLIE